MEKKLFVKLITIPFLGTLCGMIFERVFSENKGGVKMKKRILMFSLIFIFIVTLSFSFGPTISIIIPNSGYVWNKGKTYTIKWVYSGKMDSNVKITLYKPNLKTLQMIIAKPTANDGSYTWKVPFSIPNGKYVIRVKTMDNTVYANSAVFTINSVPLPSGTLTVIPPGYIKVTNPKKVTNCAHGSKLTITWIKVGKMDPNVKITLYKPDLKTLQMVIVKPTPNDGSYTWKIPSSIPDGLYVIRVKTMDNTLYDNSEVFTIGNPPPVFNPFPPISETFKTIELIVYAQGSGPVSIEGGAYIKFILVKYQIKSPVTIKLMRGSEVIHDFGTFKPIFVWSNGGKVLFNSIPDTFKLRINSEIKGIMSSYPGDFRIVVMTEGGDLLGDVGLRKASELEERRR